MSWIICTSDAQLVGFKVNVRGVGRNVPGLSSEEILLVMLCLLNIDPETAQLFPKQVCFVFGLFSLGE